jgi:beta-phosphoglucomutase
MESSGLEVVIFDAEGVVVDTEGAWDLAQEELLARRGLAYERDTLKPLLTGRSSMEGARLLVERFGLPDSPETIEAERRELVYKYLSSGVRFVDGFLDFYAEVKLLYRTCVATAMDLRVLRIVDGWLGLSSMFENNVVALDQPGIRAKPEPDLFLLAAARMQASPGSCMAIEDSPYGIESAHRAGMWVVGLATTYPASALRAANHIIAGYGELDPANLERLFWGPERLD